MDFSPLEFNKTQLPTKRDVIKHLLFMRAQNKNRTNGLSKFYYHTIAEISKLWKTCRIPIKSLPAIWKKLEYLTKSYRDIKKNPFHLNDSEWNKLFIIALCECSLDLKNPCKCPTEKQIPPHVWEFYIDQTGPRLLSLKIESAICPSSYFSTPCVSKIKSECSYVPQYSTIDESDQYSPLSEDEDYKFDSDSRKLPLPTFSAALDRAGVSNRYGALLVNTLLKDLNISGIIVDQHKIRRERNKARDKCLKNKKSNCLLKGISFDGKRERTLKQIVVNGSPRNVRVTEEHITMVKEPNSCYIGYITPTDSKGSGVAMGIIEFLRKEQYSLEHLVAVNCDGTRANTGKYNGTICIIERQLQRPLQWFVCLFHFNELPFVALLKNMLGIASGPQTWPGIMGHALKDCENIPVVSNFEPIAMGKMPENILSWDLRDDQKYLYEMVKAVDTGFCNSRLASTKPGLLNLSRWLTTASRILRLYVTQPVASDVLKKLAFFVMTVYAPFWFLIKSQPQAVHGSRHLLKYIKLIRELPIEMQEIVQRSVQINGFFAHHENIILSMITDESKEIRMEGYDLIFRARTNIAQNVRQFNVPKILFDSESLRNMINWNELEHITEPPCTQFYSDKYLKEYHDSNEVIPDFPCHSQNTERFVKVVSQSCLFVTEKNRAGFIANKIESCKLYSKIESRKDFL